MISFLKQTVSSFHRIKYTTLQGINNKIIEIFNLNMNKYKFKKYLYPFPKTINQKDELIFQVFV